MASVRHKRKRKRRRSRFGVLFKLLCGVALVAALTFGATVFFQVETIAVTGNSRYTQEEIISASGVEVGDNLFRMSKKQISEQILHQLPYVESVSILRGLPSTLTFQVTEWDAVAQVEVYSGSSAQGSSDGDTSGGDSSSGETEGETQTAAQQAWLISVGGKLLEPVSASHTAPISVTGLTALVPEAGSMLAVPQDQQSRLTALVNVLDQLQEQNMMSRVSSIDLTHTSYLQLRLDGSVDAKLPLTGDTAYYLRALSAAVEEENRRRGGQAVGTMDLTQKEYTAIFTPAEGG